VLSEPTRRQFATSLALLATAPLAVDTAAEPALAQAEAPKHTIDALFDIVRGRYGKFLTPAQLESVKRSISRNQLGAEFIKRVKLANSDEPAFAFRADLP
jgi:hypothetical protein